MGSKAPIHVLLVSFPGQGHINPLLRLGKCLAAKGLFVTFVTTEDAGKDMTASNNITHKSVTPVGDGFLKFEFFDECLKPNDPIKKSPSTLTPHVELVGKKFISQMIKQHEATNIPISCIINNPFYPWVVDVASDHGIPSALLWIQSTAVFSAYYHYFHKLIPFPSNTEPYIDVQLPSILLKYNEIPDFLHPSSPFPFFGTLILEQFKNLSKPFCVLVDTFDELEHDSIKNLSKYIPIRSIGPLFKIDTKTNISGNFFMPDDCIIGWLNSRPLASVVYISFGSIVHLPQKQVDEIAYGLVNSKVSFLWVLKPPHKHLELQPHFLPNGFIEETSNKGKVVQWSPQEQVLAHPSVACFLTHCGWNSSTEALTLGVPVLTFPAWGDQVTNTKFLVDVLGIGVRLGYSQAENKMVTRDEVKKCLLEATIGSKAEELKRNALRWKKAAEAAVADGGSSERNLNAFLEDIKKLAHN
ncbi:PREDICTED: cinnamate beta-D-glucosyltransferase-like [Lupinus angustifolius]|uniref:cinnamate beta-D-glucosyltransferase-like n=1 Tax=Lupinus angustifolius TaxID=3871 RepID=UPI00092F5DC0|nr:PREDICTED: cinnamate beta-D-glucosyltransferase-like [Lupinus angustifolius]